MGTGQGSMNTTLLASLMASPNRKSFSTEYLAMCIALWSAGIGRYPSSIAWRMWMRNR